jgi:peroxiredoxin Q/BCP
MRDGYSKFTKRGAEILAVGPNDAPTFKQYWKDENIPYVGLADPDHKVAQMYRQEVNIMKLGRMPLVCVVDGNGRIRYAHYGSSMSDIPDNETLLNVIDELFIASIG